MSFRKNATVTVQRKTTTQDASGGQVNSWAAYVWDADTGATTINLPCSYWPVGATRNESTLGQPLGISHFQFAFEVDYGIKIGDKIVMGGRDFQVIGPGNPFQGTSTVYVVNATGKVM